MPQDKRLDKKWIRNGLPTSMYDERLSGPSSQLPEDWQDRLGRRDFGFGNRSPLPMYRCALEGEMSTRDDTELERRREMITLYQDRYLRKCQQVSELRFQVRRWQFLAWLLGITSAALLVILIWG